MKLKSQLMIKGKKKPNLYRYKLGTICKDCNNIKGIIVAYVGMDSLAVVQYDNHHPQNYLLEEIDPMDMNNFKFTDHLGYPKDNSFLKEDKLYNVVFLSDLEILGYPVKLSVKIPKKNNNEKKR